MKEIRSWPCHATVWVSVPRFPPSIERTQGCWLPSAHLHGIKLSIASTTNSLRLILSTSVDFTPIFCAPIVPSRLAFALLPSPTVTSSHGERLAVSVVGYVGSTLRSYIFICSFSNDGNSIAQDIAAWLKRLVSIPSNYLPSDPREQAEIVHKVGTEGCLRTIPPRKCHNQSKILQTESFYIDSIINGPMSAGLMYWGDEFAQIVEEVKSKWPVD